VGPAQLECAHVVRSAGREIFGKGSVTPTPASLEGHVIRFILFALAAASDAIAQVAWMTRTSRRMAFRIYSRIHLRAINAR
jgi:hypothetical protein